MGASTSERAWDATFFIETLAERESSRGLPFFIKLDEDGRLENSDSSSVTKFSEEWDTLLAPLRAGPPSPARAAALEWLDSLAERREKWAATQPGLGSPG